MINVDTLARELESTAVDLARGAGLILADRFGRQLQIDYKDKDKRDPVTDADKSAQEYLAREITRRHPNHGILGEEDTEESEEPCPEVLWVLDPLDGTTNFLNGLPVYASSIGVLYRGMPLAGAIFVPWPKEGGGLVVHCRRGGGCFADGEMVSVYESQEPGPNRLIGLPGHFGQTTRVRGKLGGRLGEPRTTGSAAYELAMTACGILQYSVMGAPHLWDVAAGVLAVLEAKGTVMVRRNGQRGWHPLDYLVSDWDMKTPSFKDLRKRVVPLVAGNSQVAPLIAHNMRQRFRPFVLLRRAYGRLRPRQRS
jgi:myo-inositol-1(or 4)-monophosphatase